jgi:hypothetical protein
MRDRPKRLSDKGRPLQNIARCIERRDFSKAATLLERHMLYTGAGIRRHRENGGLAGKSSGPRGRYSGLKLAELANQWASAQAGTRLQTSCS